MQGIEVLMHTEKAVETFFYWPTLRRDVDSFVRAVFDLPKGQV